MNGRPVWDNGAARSVLVGASRFIVEGMKIPFFISLSIPHQYVDVNVHPRKIEVRFANPYRVYSAIESAVKRAFQDSLREDSTAGDDASAERLRPISQTPRLFRASAGDRDGDYRISGESHFRAGRSSQREIDDSLSFSKRVLQDFNRDDTYLENGSTVLEKPAFSDPMKVNVDERISARQYLNRYIVAEVQGNLYIIDQHAAAERIRFEKLKKEYDSQGIDRQGVMIPVCLSLSDTEALFVKEVLFHLESLGYECSVEKNKVTISSVPALLQNADHEKLFMQILSELQDVEPGDNTRGILQEKVRDSLLATMACHSSIRMNQKISDIEATRLVRDLFACQNAYSCPHGRPIVWRVTPSEIDERFNR